MVQKIIEIYCRSVKRRVACKNRGKMNSVANAKFRNLGNSPSEFGSPPALEHLQQHKTKNYEKISLKMRKLTIEIIFLLIILKI